MIAAFTSYLAGAAAGLAVVYGYVAGWQEADLLHWLALNLGASVWTFGGCALAFFLSLLLLQRELSGQPDHHRVVHLDQLSDVLASFFVGIGVIWTAVGMRNALVNTLSVPDSLANDAGQVLERLVDGGILLALSTTIVGAVGGYLMRLGKTIYLGGLLSAFYAQHERQDLSTAVERLESIEQLLQRHHEERLQGEKPGGTPTV